MVGTGVLVDRDEIDGHGEKRADRSLHRDVTGKVDLNLASTRTSVSINCIAVIAVLAQQYFAVSADRGAGVAAVECVVGHAGGALRDRTAGAVHEDRAIYLAADHAGRVHIDVIGLASLAVVDVAGAVRAVRQAGTAGSVGVGSSGIGGVGAEEGGLELATSRAAVSGDVVAVVAVLDRQEDAVAAARRAGIAHDVIANLARLAVERPSEAADDAESDAGAVDVAAVVGGRVGEACVAGVAGCGVDAASAAGNTGCAGAFNPSRNIHIVAVEGGLQRACRRASISIVEVAVVAGLRPVSEAVSALRDASVAAAIEVVASCAIRADGGCDRGVVIAGDALGDWRAVNDASSVEGVASVAGAASGSVATDLAEIDATCTDTCSVSRIVIGAVESRLYSAGWRASVGGVEVAVVAALRRYADAVSASGHTSVTRYRISSLTSEADGGVAG